MADKASRGLIVIGDGFGGKMNETHSHLHSLASLASCGFLTLPISPPSESEDERVVRELAELLDSNEAVTNISGEYRKSSTPTISERFMGMKAAIVTNNLSLKRFGESIGLAVLELDGLTTNNHPHEDPSLDFVASELLKLLGFQEGKTCETSQFDLVVVHIGVGEKEKIILSGIEYINGLVGRIMGLGPPGSEIGSRLHLSVVMSYGAVSEDGDPSLSILPTKDSLLFPRQSYTVKGGNLRKNIRHHGPMLIAQWQDAVTRKDMAETFSFKSFKENGGNLAIPADRFLHEIAFKLWKAPKYGA